MNRSVIEDVGRFDVRTDGTRSLDLTEQRLLFGKDLVETHLSTVAKTLKRVEV